MKCTANNAGWHNKAVQEIVRIPITVKHRGVDSSFTLTNCLLKMTIEILINIQEINVDEPAQHLLCHQTIKRLFT
nr:hypothetical protein [Escherichia coli]